MNAEMLVQHTRLFCFLSDILTFTVSLDIHSNSQDSLRTDVEAQAYR